MIRWPGRVPAVVSEEMLAATNWLPTLAGMAGVSNLVPKDRPIDGIDASAYMLGTSNTTGRDTYMLFGTDGDLMAIKWKMFKTIFRYSESFGEPVVKPAWPLTFNLSSEPHEKWNLIDTRMDHAWIFAVAIRIIMQYESSAKEFPNIKTGEDFHGYERMPLRVVKTK